MGKDRAIRGFHDVCRHRAYKVTKKSTGSTLVFGCRYHGWSYDTTGALVRAPEFEEVKTFRWKDNGLMPVTTRLSPEGLVFVNFSASSKVPHFQSDTLKASIPSGIVSPEAHLIKEIDLSGEYNWKLSAEALFGQAKGILKGTTLSIFPTTSIFWSSAGTFWISVIHEPASSKKTHIRLDVFACNGKITVPESALTAIETQLQSYVRELEQLQEQVANQHLQHAPLQRSAIGTTTQVLSTKGKLTRR
jgi:hypothetical protein